MPIGSRCWRWFEPRLRSGSTGMKAGLAALFVCAAFVYVFLGPLVFDASYWVLGKAARVQADRRLRVGVSVAFVAVYLVAVSVSGSTVPKRTAAEATSTPLVSANATSPSVASTTTASATAPTVTISVSPVASNADSDDEASSSAGASFAPNATGIVPPTSSAGPAERLPGEPDPALTPGALNAAVTQVTIRSTICVSGWTATIRPDSSYTDALKVQQIAEYGYSDTKTSSYEEDHLISLELGGAPSDPRNLWPEPYTVTLADGRATGAHTKDAFETKLKSEVCAGTITLVQAQGEIGDHWVHAYYGIALVASPTDPTSTAEPTEVPTAGATAPPTALGVTFVSLPNPAPLGGVAHLEAQTSAGANCTIVVTWPSGNKSGAGGLKTNPTAGADGIVSWDWNVASTTKPGTAKTTVTCTLNGASAHGAAQFPVS